MKYSVLIPVYNTEKYLQECIESVLKQTYQDFEIILINDGSIDNSGNICDKYTKMDSRIKVFHQDNQGHTLARRKAFEKSSGDYCIFLDSDDYWDYNLLEIIDNIIWLYNCDLIIFRYKKITDQGFIKYESKSIFENNTIFDIKNKYILFEKIINSQELNNLVCKVAKRNLIETDDNYLQYSKVKNGEDLIQSLHIIYNAEKILYLNKALYNYRTNFSSITNNFNINLYKDVTIVKKVILDYLIKMNLDSEENLILLYEDYIKIILRYINNMFSFPNLSYSEQKRILNEIKNEQFYLNSIKYIDKKKFNFFEKPLFYLLNKNKYYMMRILSNLLFIVKKVYKMLKGDKK